MLVTGGNDTNFNPLSSAELYHVGLGFSASWQPQIATFTSPIVLSSNLTLTGSLFRGISEGSGGDTQSSPADYPAVQLRSLESGQTVFLPATNFTSNSFVSAAVANFPPGFALVTVFVNGIPSTSSILAVIKATASVTLSDLNQTYDGTPKNAVAATAPYGLTVSLTYNGLASAPTNAGSYIVIGTVNDANYQGSATNTLVIIQAAATVILGNLSQVYDGSGESVSATTLPAGLAVNFTYNGSADAPTNAGSYTVIGTVNDANYQGSATNTLVVSRAAATVILGNLSQVYDGSSESASVTTLPPGLSVNVTYNGSAIAPTNAGSYTVNATINDPNYQGSSMNTLVIGQATATIVLGGLSQYYDGTAKSVSVTTVPPGLLVNVTYDGSANAPVNLGGYTVIATVKDSNYQGSVTNTLLITLSSGVYSFLSASPLTTPRYAHTATLLPSGELLIAGGLDYSGIVSSAELYNPANGAWTLTGALTVARAYHTATLLTNGLVLVAGGLGDSGGAELYNPISGIWTPTGALTTPRSSHTATLLLNGKVLVAGGLANNGILSSAEVYDPSTGTWTATGAMTAGRAYHTATLLSNGKVLVTGGLGDIGTAEVYDPANGTWTATTGALNTARAYHTATLMPNGEVLVVGGFNFSSGYLSSAEVYNTDTGTWTPTGALATERDSHTATLLPSGKVMVAGGINNQGEISSGELYDPATGTWTVTGPLTTAREWHTATLLSNGKMLVAGGFGSTGSLSAVETYDPENGTWTMTGGMTTSRDFHTATLLPNGQVLVAGGYNFTGGDLSSAELFNPVTGIWALTGTLHTARYSHTATLLPSGKVLVAGGYNGPNPSTSAELYDPASRTWTATEAMQNGRFNHTATLLFNGKVLVAGGANFTGAYPSLFATLADAELYDPATGTWTATGAMTIPRQYHTATLLPDGQVLVAGGTSDVYTGSEPDRYNSLSSAELYDPATGIWTETGPMTTARYEDTSTLLPNGQVLVAGGFDSSGILSSAELYNPSVGTWMATTNAMINAHELHSATLVPNGKVLIAGGNYNAPEMYDPATGTWAATGALNASREFNTATLLTNGMVLVAGGYDGFQPEFEELYDVGLGFSGAWQPQIASITSPLGLGGNVMLTGSQFRGLSEGSGGNSSQNSPGDNPVMQLRSVESGQTLFLLSTNWTTNSFLSAPLIGFPPGYALVTVFVNGIPSPANIINISVPVPTTPRIATFAILSDGSFQFSFINRIGAQFSVLATTDLSLPLNNWMVLGGILETSPGQFTFTDSQAINNPHRFYIIRSQ